MNCDFWILLKERMHLLLIVMCGRFWLLDRHVVRMLMVDLLQIVMCVWSEEPICHRRNFAHLCTISAVDCHNHLCWSSAYLLHCLAITIGCVLLNHMIYAEAMLPWLFFTDMFLLQCCTLQSPAFLWIYNSAIFQTFALPHCYIGRITLFFVPSASAISEQWSLPTAFKVTPLTHISHQ